MEIIVENNPRGNLFDDVNFRNGESGDFNDGLKLMQK